DIRDGHARSGREVLDEHFGSPLAVRGVAGHGDRATVWTERPGIDLVDHNRLTGCEVSDLDRVADRLFVLLELLAFLWGGSDRVDDPLATGRECRPGRVVDQNRGVWWPAANAELVLLVYAVDVEGHPIATGG